ncbi:MAG: enoyl-CoA hydratase-related protein [Acidimicrobiales bacterium]
MALIETEVRDRAGILTLNDPEKRNAITLAMNDEIVAVLDEWEADDAIGALVLTGAPPPSAPAADLDDLLADQGPEGMKRIYEGFLRIAHTSLPTIAAVNGAAVGAGFNMVLACDIAVAAREKARFDSRFLQIALHPGGGHTWRLRSIAGRQTTMAMVLFGEVVRAQQALELGVVWKVVDDESLVDECVALAAVAAGQGKELNARTKASILALDTVTESDAAVDHELWPQLWSMDQGDFRDLVSRLQQHISSKNG